MEEIKALVASVKDKESLNLFIQGFANIRMNISKTLNLFSLFLFYLEGTGNPRSLINASILASRPINLR